MPYSSIKHTKSNGESLFAIVSLEVLSSLNDAEIQALHKIDIFSVSDLLRYGPIHKAQLLMALHNGEIAHETTLNNLLDNDALNTSLSSIPALSIEHIRGIGSRHMRIFNDAFQVSSVAQLATFAPFLEAQRFLERDDETFNEPASAPNDLMPKILGNIATKVSFSDFIKSKRISLPEYQLDSAFNRNKKIPLVLNQGNLLLHNVFNTKKIELHFGTIAKYIQTWQNKGTHLGEIIHSLALAPGESKNIAVIDWHRQQSSRRGEDTTATERLNNSLIYKRALNEVIETTATQHLEGSTTTESRTKSTSEGNTSGLGLGLGAAASAVVPVQGIPLNIGKSFGFGFNKGKSKVTVSNEQYGTIKTVSDSSQALFSETKQNINDSTVQNAENIRSVRSSIVVSDEQQEREEIITRNVTNYNHSHALTIQYYEVIQKYLIATNIATVTPLVWLPYQPLKFTFENIKQYWHLLQYPLIEIFGEEKFFAYQSVIEGYDYGDINFDKDTARIKSAIISLRIDSNNAKNQSNLSPTYILSSQDILRVTLKNKADEPVQDLLKKAKRVIQNSASYLEEVPVDLPLDQIAKIIITNDTPFLEALINNREFQISLKIKFVLKDANGSETRTRYINYARIINHREFQNEIEIQPNLPNWLEEEIDYQTNSLKELDVVQQLLDHFEFNKYGYTRFLLQNIEEERMIDYIENLEIKHDDSAFIPLTKFIDHAPIAFTQNLIGFRLIKHQSSSVPTTKSIDDKKLLADSNHQNILAGTFQKCVDELLKSFKASQENDVIGDEIYLPTAGVFAEAILGRANGSEFVDPRRFWNWQDSPIPHMPPPINPIYAGSRAQEMGVDGDTSPTIPEANINIIPPYALPSPSTVAMLNALNNPNMFPDMTKAEVLANTLSNITSLAQAVANNAGNLAGSAGEQALTAAVKMGEQAANLVSKLMDNPRPAPPPQTPTEKAAALNLPSNRQNGKLEQKKVEREIAGISTDDTNGSTGNSSNKSTESNNNNTNVDTPENVGENSSNDSNSANTVVKNSNETTDKTIIVRVEILGNNDVPIKGGNWGISITDALGSVDADSFVLQDIGDANLYTQIYSITSPDERKVIRFGDPYTDFIAEKGNVTIPNDLTSLWLIARLTYKPIEVKSNTLEEAIKIVTERGEIKGAIKVGFESLISAALSGSVAPPVPLKVQVGTEIAEQVGANSEGALELNYSKEEEIQNRTQGQVELKYTLFYPQSIKLEFQENTRPN